MQWFISAVVALIAATSCAKAETISLLCGFETIIVDTEAKSVRVQEASLDKQTRAYKRREFKDGYKHSLFGAQVQDYMSVTDASISYGHDDGPHVNAVHYRIDRYTGILVSSLYNPTTCSVLPPQRMF
jgi:phosphoribulokinase